jgi:glycosyltransferase involved in cell wall biosynthesis
MSLTESQHILLIVSDPIGEEMAGPGIRFWEFARVLSQYGSVTLAVPPLIPMPSIPPRPDFEAEIVICRTVAALHALAKKTDVIITLGGMLAQYPFLAETGKPLVLDLYDPFLLATLHRFTDHSMPERLSQNEGCRRTHVFQIRAADFMICASERQRDYWLGMLAILGRINPFTNDEDSTLRRLIDVVPFGLPPEPPQHKRQVLKGVYKTIAAQDKVILWGGGIWNWFDAPAMIKAMSIIVQQRADVKLFFMGIKRPNPTLPKMPAVEEAIALSKQLDLYDRNVFFNDWTPYHERQNYLLEADIGVSLHLNHAETRFSFRTRFLDYLWAGLPILATEGDVLSEVVQKWGVGRVVKPGDVAGIAQAVLDLLDTPDLRETCQPRFKEIAAQYNWAEVTRPLVDFCINPRPAPDKTYLKNAPIFESITTSWWSLPKKVWRIVKQYGPRGLFHEIGEYLKWRLKKSR